MPPHPHTRCSPQTPPLIPLPPHFFLQPICNCVLASASFNASFAIWLSGRDKITGSLATKYVVAQCLGGVLGGFSYAYTTKGKTFPLGPQGEHSWVNALVAELLFTFVLAYTVLCVATVKQASKDMFGLAIGFCVVVGGFAAGSVSGGSLNPAVSLGIDTSASVLSTAKWMNCLPYGAAELAGGALLVLH